MSTTIKNKPAQGVRYTDAQKKEVVDFANNYNAANGRGGQSKAASKFKISQITVASWLKGAAKPATQAGAEASAPKVAKATKPTKAAKAPKAPKAVKVAKASKAPKAAGKSKVGTRYTNEQKKEVVDFVASYNASNGRGGQSTAASKFKISPLTVMAWLKASGITSSPKKSVKKGSRYVAPGKAAKQSPSSKPASPSGGFDAKLSALLALSKEIAKAESALALLNSKFSSLKASL